MGSVNETDKYWEEISENEPLITIISCDDEAVGENTVETIRKKIFEEEVAERVIIDLKAVKTIWPLFVKGINAITARSKKKIALVVPSLTLRSKLIGSALNLKINLCKSVEEAKNELAERSIDIDELKRRVRRGYYNR